MKKWNTKDIKIYELPCFDNRATFYGKAFVIDDKDGKFLKSYDTVVCYLSNDGVFEKMWDDYSSTTMRHINSFLEFNNIHDYKGKAWWNSLDTNVKYKLK